MKKVFKIKIFLIPLVLNLMIFNRTNKIQTTTHMKTYLTFEILNKVYYAIKKVIELIICIILGLLIK